MIDVKSHQKAMLKLVDVVAERIRSGRVTGIVGGLVLEDGGFVTFHDIDRMSLVETLGITEVARVNALGDFYAHRERVCRS